MGGRVVDCVVVEVVVKSSIGKGGWWWRDGVGVVGRLVVVVLSGGEVI